MDEMSICHSHYENKMQPFFHGLSSLKENPFKNYNNNANKYVCVDRICEVIVLYYGKKGAKIVSYVLAKIIHIHKDKTSNYH